MTSTRSGNLWRASAACAVLASITQVAGASESGPGAWFVPVVRPYTLAVGGGIDVEPDAGGGGPRYERDVRKASLRVQVWNDDANEIVLSGTSATARSDTEATFASVQTYPERLFETRLGALYRHVTPARQVYGVSATVSSGDSRPFAGSESTDISAAAFMRHQLARDAWLLTLVYTEDAPVLRGVPLPGASYEWHPTTTVTAVIGVPVSMLMWREAGSSLEAAVSIFGGVRLAAATTPCAAWPWLRLQAGFDHGFETWQWPEHLDGDDRVHLRAARITGGLAVVDGPLIQGRLYAGWAFAREIIIGDSVLDADEEIALPPGPVFGISASLTF